MNLSRCIKTLFVVIAIFLAATGLYAQEVSVASAGIQGKQDSRHILLIVKNTGKKALKNVRVSCVLTLKMNIKGAESIIERDDVFDVPSLAVGKTMERKSSANQAVMECQKVSKIEVTQR
jgi:biopolymer transport protein ExbD